jgi:glutathione S-transferase
MKLHVFPPSPRAIKVIALKNYLGLECQVRVLDFFKEEQKSPEFAALNPNRRMPVLEDGDLILWESNAILKRLASKKPDSGLWPQDARRQDEVLRWLFWEIGHWDPACGLLIEERVKKIIFKTGTPDMAAIGGGERVLARLCAILDAALNRHRWLAGNELTIADFAVAAWLPAGQLAKYSIAGYPAIERWYDDVGALPGWREALPAPRTRLE